MLENKGPAQRAGPFLWRVIRLPDAHLTKPACEEVRGFPALENANQVRVEVGTGSLFCTFSGQECIARNKL